MSTKTCYAYFDFPVAITGANGYVYAFYGSTNAKMDASNFKIEAVPAKSESISAKSGTKVDSPIMMLFYIPETETLEYYYGMIWITSYQDANGNSHPVEQGKAEYLVIFTSEDDTFYIGPQSTVAAAYAFARGFNLQLDNYMILQGSTDFKTVAYAMLNNLYVTGGGVSKVISSPPNDMQTNSYAVYNALSTLLYYCLVDEGFRNSFFKCVNQIPGVNVSNTLNAIVALAQNPFDITKEIYDLLLTRDEIYTPSFKKMQELGVTDPAPGQWTLAIKINDSGARNFLIAGTAYTVFDKDNKAWVTNNFRQGTPNSGGHCMVFNPDGSPASISPIMGGGILGPGFGVAVNPAGDTIAFGNYGWGSKDYNPLAGSISVFSSDGAVLSPPGGFIKGLCRVQGMCYDQSGNLWMASWGTQAPMEDPDGPHIYDVPSQPSALVCYVDGNPDKFLVYNDFGTGPSEWHGTFGVVMDKDGNCIVSNAGTGGKMISSVYKISLSAEKDKLNYIAHWESDWTQGNTANFEELRQPQIDNDGYIYVGGITSCRVVKLNGDTLKKEDEFFHNIYGPWGITIDSLGKKFVTGFGAKYKAKDDIVVTYGRDFGITVVDPDDSAWGSSNLMTLPSGGAEVRLANGQPLYGNQELPVLDGSNSPDGIEIPEGAPLPNGGKMPPSYSPLMRTTSTSIDRAGNLWCANNWKPSLYSDVFTKKDPNPGGDGIVIFIGVAEPLAPMN